MQSGGERRQLRQRLESLHRAGVTHLPRARATQNALQIEADHQGTASQPRHGSVASARESPAQDRKLHGAAPSTSESAMAAAMTASLFDAIDRGDAVPPEERPARLAQLADEVAACTRCSALVECRSQTVFGVGSPQAQLCFVGEAPGQEEDRQGEPFVGAAGKLLNKIIAACRLKREDVYICNVLKCRPPGNRNPLPDEVANCMPYLQRQLDVLRPSFLCALGGVAAQVLLETNLSVGKLRGRFHQYRGIPLVCTYHPAYLLRNPSAKAQVWEDMKMLMARMGVEL